MFRKETYMKIRFVKALTALLLCASVLISPCLLVSSNASFDVELPFKDVKSSQWFYGAVYKVYTSGLMEGKSEDVFDPKSTMTRAELVTLMSRLAGADVTGMDKFADLFKDVGKKAWYRNYVGWAAKYGLAQGYAGGLFKPNEPIRRVELAAFITRLIDFIDLELPVAPLIDWFSDEVIFPDWGKNSIEQMRIYGLIEGNDKGRFLPYSSVTRAEVATIVSRFCNYLSADPMHEALRNISKTMETVGGRAVIHLGDASTVTEENISHIIINCGTTLDEAVYSLVCDKNELELLRNGQYASISAGEYYNTELSVYIRNNNTGETTDTVKLNLRIVKAEDFESEMLPEFRYKIKADGTAEIVEYIGVRYVKNLTIPKYLGGLAVTSIGKEAFKESRELVSVTIPDSVTFIDTEAFSLCTGLESVAIPDSVTKFGRAAFYYCTSLTEVTLPKNLKRIPDYMFYMCTSLDTAVTYDSLEEVGKYAFSNCVLTDFNFNEGLEIVGEYAFEGCMLLKVYLPDSCTYAGHWAFYNCLWLSEASFGNNLTLIGSGVLYNTSVAELHYRGTAEEYHNTYKLSAFSEDFPIVFEK